MTGRSDGIWATIRKTLDEVGIDIELPELEDLDPEECKVVCMPLGLSSTLRDMAKGSRDNVVMVRVDDETVRSLDAWIETGAVKSRSEAAALFIREGLAIRAEELRDLEDALREVEEAKERLRRKARSVLREEEEGGEKA